MAKPIKRFDLRRPREASVNLNQVSLNDNAYRQPVDPRRRPEYNDAQMIQEDHRAVANLPEREINRQFTPGKYQPHYWMESEIIPFGVDRANEPEDE